MKRIQLVILLLALSACSPKVDNNGYIQEGDLKSQIVPGQTTRDEVRAKFGSPSAQSSFGDETWYYITSRKETLAFLAPEVADQHVTRIAFDAAGVVSDVKAFSKADAVQFDVVKRATPTEGHQLGFFEQALGNIGRFNKPGNDTIAPGRRPGR